MALTLEETRTFSRNLNEYKEAKRIIIEKWSANCKLLLTLEAIKDGWPEKLSELLQPALTFLQEHGVINFGVNLQSPEPPAAAPAPPEAAPEAGQDAAAAPPKKPSKAEIVDRLYTILRTADFAVMTEKKIRAQLEADLGCDMGPYRALVRKHVMHVVGHLDERESLEPLPLSDDEAKEEAGDSKRGSKGGTGKAGKEGKGAKQSQQQQEDAKAKEPPHVVVVGAGLAGLVAATVLQRNGCKVTVLEAQRQSGGRLAKLFQASSAAGEPAGTAPEGLQAGALADAALAAFGPVSLHLPALAATGADGQGDSGERPTGPNQGDDEQWPAGAVALRTLCSQLGIVPLPLAAAASGGDAGAMLVHRPRLYGGSGGGGADGDEAEAPGVSIVAPDVQGEAEGLLAELLATVRRRLDELDERGKQQPNGHGTAKPSAAAAASTPLAASLAEELEAEIGRRAGKQPSAAASEGAAGASTAAGTASAGVGVKRPAEEDEAPGAGEGGAEADGADRPSKRSRGDLEGGADKDADAAPAAGEAAGDKTAAEGAGGSGQGAEQTPQPPPPEQSDTEAAAGGGRIRQEVLYVLRNHLLPLLELRLGAPLTQVAPSQLRLIARGELLGGGLPLLPEAVASQQTAQPQVRRQGLGLLPVGGARHIVEALAADLDVRTGVAVTAVSVMAGGGVKVSTDAAGIIKAAAAVLAVPHVVLQSGAIALDAPPPYRTTSAARVGVGAGVSLSLRLPLDADLAPLCGGDSAVTAAAIGGELRPFFVRSAAGASAAEAAPPGGGQQGVGLGFLFCPAGEAPSPDAGAGPAGGSQNGTRVLVAHVTSGGSATSPLELSDEDLRRQAVAALQAATAAVSGDQPPAAALRDRLEPVSCHVVRWAGPAAAAGAAAGSGSGRAAAAAARGGACAHLALRGYPRDMALLAGPIKGRLFFAGEHTAPDQLPYGLLTALAASGLREAARVLKAVKGSGAAGSGKAAAATALEVGDEPPLQKLIAAAEAEAKAEAAAEAEAAKSAAAKAGSKGGKSAGTDKAKAKGRSSQVVASDSDSEGEEAAEEEAGAKRRKKDEGGKGSKAPGRGKDKQQGRGKAGKEDGDKEEEEEEALEDEEEEEGSEDGSASEEDLEEEADAKKKKNKKEKGGKAAGKQRKAAGKAKRGSEEEDEEEEEEEDEEEADAKGSKKRKKRRRGGYGSDGEEGGSDDAKEGEGDGKRSKAGRRGEKERKEDAAQLDLLDKQKRQQALAKLQADRKDVKVVYKAMMAASNGTLGPLREQMSSCAGLDAKMVMLQALQKSTLQVLQLLANDSAVLTWLRDWLMELCDDSSAEHLVLMELRLLERLPLSGEALAVALAAAAAAEGEEGGAEQEGAAAAAAAAGGGSQPVRALLAAVRERCAAHRSKDVKRMAAQVATAWERRAALATSVRAGTGAGATSSTGAGGAHPSGLPPAPRPPLFNPKNLVSLRSTPPPPVLAGAGAAATTASGGRPPQVPSRPAPQPAAPGASRPTGSDAGGGSRLTPPPSGVNGAGGSEAASGPSGGSTGDAAAAAAAAAPRLDPALEAKLMAAKAAAEAARQEAALAAQRRAEVQQEAQAAGGVRGPAKPEIDTFEDYRRTERGGGSNGGGSGSGTKHKDGSGGGSSGKHKSSGGSGSGGSGSGLAELKAAVVDHIKQQLKRYHKAGTISSSDFRLIQEKASNKVFETLTEASAAHSHSHGSGSSRDLLGSKRREKISNLVEQYVKKAAANKNPHTHQQAGPGGGAAPE